jgi:threonine dehydrogenase-like Zn-dependent dehydrogenase
MTDDSRITTVNSAASCAGVFLAAKQLIVSERGDEGVEPVRQLTGGFGVQSVFECVGLEQSMRTAISIARPGGAVGRVGVPQGETMPASLPAFYGNVTVSGGPTPVRAYMEELLPDILRGESSRAGCSTAS